jgi:hypothetical protein
LVMSALKSAGLRLTGSAPVGSGCAATGLAGLGSSVDGPAGLAPEGAVGLLTHAAQVSVAAIASGHVCRGFIIFPPRVPTGELGKSPMKNL